MKGMKLMKKTNKDGAVSSCFEGDGSVKKKKLDLRSVIITLALVFGFALVLTLGIFVVPRLFSGEGPFLGSWFNNVLTPEASGTEGTVTETATPETQIPAEYEELSLGYYDGYETTVWGIIHFSYSNVYSTLTTFIRKDIAMSYGTCVVKEPSYIPKGYKLNEEYKFGEKIKRKIYTSDLSGKFDLMIEQALKYDGVSRGFTDNERLYIVKSEGFYGVLSEYEGSIDFLGNKGMYRYLTFTDGKMFYRLGGIEFSRQELLRIALGLKVSQGSIPSVEISKDGGFPSEFVNFPVGYLFGYVDTVGKYRLMYEGEYSEGSSSAYSLYSYGNTLAEDGHLFPDSKGYSVTLCSENNYIYTLSGEDMFVFSVKGIMYGNTVRYSSESCAFYTVKIGDGEGLLIAEDSKARCLVWNTEDHNYCIEALSDKMSAEEMLRLARSMKNGCEYTINSQKVQSFKHETTATNGEVRAELSFFDGGDHFVVSFFSFAENRYAHEIASMLYENGKDGSTIVNDLVYHECYNGGIVYRFVLSKKAFENGGDYLLNYFNMVAFSDRGWGAWYTYDGNTITQKLQ